ncbi:GNAT family N-acetyltransferase [Oryzicola mucosus]|uniref:GNAT family N-acetyltransferase n=1 Tax=Oryzicola mucosus TaxID=2767425 RepID=A0A8J6PSF8_9HYPH|nr:GNAT family N-acetyltransferase [Oryzicola mucosus]MBD0413146.1 GNAT family N-acetyltransferase [Oryzicola mucosus]
MPSMKFSKPPVVETPRAILRPHRLEDFDAYAAMWTEPAVVRLFGGKPRTREESWQRFLRHPSLWSYLGFGYWAVEDRATGRFIGDAGFQDMKRALTPSIEGYPEAGWSLCTEAQGKGLASEIVLALHSWSDANLGCRTVCIINPDNAASLRVADKCGYRRYGESVYHTEPVILFERPAQG